MVLETGATYLESWLRHLSVGFSKPSIAPAPCFTVDLVLLTPGGARTWQTHRAGPSHGGAGWCRVHLAGSAGGRPEAPATSGSPRFLPFHKQGKQASKGLRETGS